MPLAAYNVSGEYAMLKAAAAAGYLDERAAVLETLTAIRTGRRRHRHHLPREGRRAMARVGVDPGIQRPRAPTSCTRRAVELMPGGVNSPVRAMRSIGRDTDLHRLGQRQRPDRRRRQRVRRLGLLVGSADPRPCPPGGARRRCQPRQRAARRSAPRPRGGGACRGDRRPDAVGRDGADDLLGHRSDDERAPPGSRRDRARPDPEVRGRLPRSCRRAARAGGFWTGDRRPAVESGRPRRPRPARP